MSLYIVGAFMNIWIHINKHPDQKHLSNLLRLSLNRQAICTFSSFQPEFNQCSLIYIAIISDSVRTFSRVFSWLSRSYQSKALLYTHHFSRKTGDTLCPAVDTTGQRVSSDCRHSNRFRASRIQQVWIRKSLNFVPYYEFFINRGCLYKH